MHFIHTGWDVSIEVSSEKSWTSGCRSSMYQPVTSVLEKGKVGQKQEKKALRHFQIRDLKPEKILVAKCYAFNINNNNENK